MCTATWIYSKAGYRLFFNRDELRTRKPGGKPEKLNQGNVTYIAPVDADAGGTWIGVNEFGFSACLLNYYSPVDQIDGEFISRGHLLRSLLDCTDIGQAEERLLSIDTAQYRSFTVLLFDPKTPGPFLVRWPGSGELLVDPKVPEPQSSSSFKTSEVVASRVRLFRKKYAEGDESGRQHYHRSHEPERGPFSVCMHRQDAKTQSFSDIEVAPERVAFTYTDGSPCKNRPQAPLSLGRRRE